MDIDDRHRLFEAARVRGELTARELWLRYLALGGNRDAFDIDGYLHGLLAMEPIEQDILAVALNERLDEVYRAARIPIATTGPDEAGTDALQRLVEDLLRDRSPTPNPGTVRLTAAPSATRQGVGAAGDMDDAVQPDDARPQGS
jgi:hypothetical protein